MAPEIEYGNLNFPISAIGGIIQKQALSFYFVQGKFEELTFHMKAITA